MSSLTVFELQYAGDNAREDLQKTLGAFTTADSTLWLEASIQKSQVLF